MTTSYWIRLSLMLSYIFSANGEVNGLLLLQPMEPVSFVFIKEGSFDL
jgi:hypothetical protein